MKTLYNFWIKLLNLIRKTYKLLLQKEMHNMALNNIKKQFNVSIK